MKKNMLALYVIVIVFAALYLLFVEGVGIKHAVNVGGQDNYFSPFDVFTIAISLVALILVVVSFMAYRRHPDNRMLLVSLAFLLFTVFTILDFVDNFFPGSYSAIGIVKKVLTLLILLTFLSILFKKS